MDGWTLCFVLLLPLTVCSDSEVTLVKTLGSKPDVTELCSNGTMNMITLIVCRISTERSRGEQCRLIYYYGKGFEHECGSKFRLMSENQTVFLHLINLTAEDSGNFTCECSQLDATFIFHLNVTVEEEEDPTISSGPTVSGPSVIPLLIGVTLIMTMSGVILGFVHRRLSHGKCSRSATTGTSGCDSSSSANHDDPDELYTNLHHPTNDLYQSVSIIHHQHDTRKSSANSNQEMDERETDANFAIYENINEDNVTV
ncbi:uncharacterized protein LOC113164664 [Anabas testudineus]|uniref:uncharacterized protein LOC113164664 n=1 Tax=Anabas testudineus TaxID=64144 RepID=UPI00143DD703|nr:uncharacterized protein LOC113164664 [Anabas testudineus]